MKLTASKIVALLLLGGAIGAYGLSLSVAQRDALAPVPGAATVQEFSSAFREVAHRALPAVVAIESNSKLKEIVRDNDEDGEQINPFGDDEIFRRFFGDDDRLKELFKNAPRGGGRRMIVPPRQGQGSGFVIDPRGYILTNNHVVDGADEVRVRFGDGKVYKAVEVKTDPRADLALIKIDANHDLIPLPLGNSDQVEVGDWVVAVGNPFGIGHSVTSGIISAKGRGIGINEREQFLQTDAAINPGNSGGPLLNMRGEVVGIATAISTRSGSFAGVAFAIPSNMARWVSHQLIDHGSVRRAYLGLGLRDLTQDVAEKLGTTADHGPLVGQVVEGAPAEKAGIQAGDVIVEFNGTEIHSAAELQDNVEKSEIGKTFPLVVIRDGKRTTLDVTLAEMPADFSPAQARANGKQKEEEAQPEADDLGIAIQPTDLDSLRKLRLPGTATGVIVKSVKPDSAAEQIGIQPGDLIIKIGSKPVTSPEDYQEAVKGVSPENGVSIVIRRREGTQLLFLQAR